MSEYGESKSVDKRLRAMGKPEEPPASIENEKLRRLEELLGKATPLPWSVGECRDGVYAKMQVLIRSDFVEIFGPRQLGYPTAPKDQLETGAELIVETVNALPALLARLRAAEGRLEAVRDETQMRGAFDKWWVSTNNRNWFSDKPITVTDLSETAWFAYRAAALATTGTAPQELEEP